MNDHLTDCPRCQTRWAVVPATMKAHPGRRSPVTRVRVPKEDAYGSRTGGTRTLESAHWVPIAEATAIQQLPDDGGPAFRYGWACLCGEAMEYAEPAWDVRDCLHGGQPCKKTRRRTWDQQRAAWQACPCCGHQGVHLVMRDGSNTPGCLA